MTYKLLKIYFAKEEIQKELLDSFYRKVQNYKNILDREYNGWEHYESIDKDCAQIPLYEDNPSPVHKLHLLNKEIMVYIEQTKERTLDAIQDGRLDEVAENLSFMVDYRGYGMVSEFFLRNDENKEDYLTSFFELRIKNTCTSKIL